MRPAFSSTKQAAAFLILLTLLVLAPWLAGKKGLPPREQAYGSEGWVWGPYPWIQKQIFNETNDIDLAFMGSSQMLWGIDTPYVQQKLDVALGRKSVVRTISWSQPGFDTLYFIAKDLLEHRRVKTLVFYDESFGDHANPKMTHWFRFGDNATALAGLDLKDQGIYYFAAVVGLPRNLLELIAPNLPEEGNGPSPNYHEIHSSSDNPETRLGSVNARLGYAIGLGDNTNFTAFAPKTEITPADFSLYSPATATNFVFSRRSLSPLQTHFARLFGLLAKEHGCRLVLLHLPVVGESREQVVTESCFWPDLMQTEVAMMGIPTGRLFAGLTDPDIKLLFGNPWHVNQNGQQYFTRIITPGLISFYESQPPR